jgi:hypothetical protein
MVRNHYKVRLQPLHFIFVLAVCVLGLLVVYGIRLIATGGRASSSTNLMSGEPSRTNEISLAAAEPKLPLCPAAGVPILQPSRHTGHHQVALSWNASSPSSDPERKAVGYCLYRSGTRNAAKRSPTCPICEQINKKPIQGTSCLDDLVKDGEKYYYVVTAINARGTSSSSSNETPAKIPSTKEGAGSVPIKSYPLCRASNQSR